ncbi:hypothetical protein EON83_08985 [bacterium]|nr:MAG: hypothetical protein EON83_08985 [bacterium]
MEKITITVKRLANWPRAITPRRGIKRGNVDYAKTRQKLIQYLQELGATSVSLGVAVDSVSHTGWPNAGHRPTFPGVCLVADSPHGQLLFACDKFSLWTHNLRAIVDTLEGIHKMLGLGTVEPQQLYAAFQWDGLEEWIAMGAFKGDLGQPSAVADSDSTSHSKAKTGARAKAKSASTSGASRPTPPPPPPPRRQPYVPVKETFETRGQAADWLAAQTGASRSRILLIESVFLEAYRQAARLLHPDVGGDPAQFRRLQNAKATIEHGAMWLKAS